MRGKFAVLAVFGVFMLLFPLCAFAGMGGGKMLNPGTLAPDFEYTDIQGAKGSLYKTAEGKPLLLVFIQTSCRSCQRELVYLQDMRRQGTHIDVLVVFVDLKQRDFKAFVKENGYIFPFLWDEDYKIAEAYGVAFTPASYLFDGNRKIAKVYRGWTGSGAELEEDLKALGVMK